MAVIILLAVFLLVKITVILIGADDPVLTENKVRGGDICHR
jgi:hypothetical protein